MLLKRASPDDQSRARAMLEQVIAPADDLGLTRLADQARTLLETTPSPAQPVRAESQHGLSAREMDVLRRIVAGRTDREIADELFISKRTVTTHVSNIFNKLGLNTRAEAAAYAVRNGLV
jgi:DNA-binding NarL/FixJ family response regulator